MRALTDIVIDPQIAQWTYDRDDPDTLRQIGALRAAASTVAAMPPAEASRQARRVAAIFIRR